MDYLQFPRHFSLLVFFSLFNGLKSKYQGCDTEPVNALFLIHGASIESGNRSNFTEQLVRDVTSSLHKDSTARFYLLTETAKELVVDSNSSEDTVINKIFAEDMKSATKSTTLSSEAINNVLSSTFSLNQYKNRAEFVILLVTNETELDAVSPFLQKKKTVVVVLGSSIPHIFKSVSSREDYLYQVGSVEDLELVIEKIKERIACDSNQYCDTDKYSTKKGSRCKSCEGPCEQKTDICTKYCLFERPKPDLNNLSEPNHMTTGGGHMVGGHVKGTIEDKKDLAVHAILIAIAILVVAVVVIVIVRWYLSKSSGQLTPGSSDETLRKTPASSVTHSVDKFPVQETDECQPFIEGQGQAAESDQTPAETIASNGIPVDLKNDHEGILNAYWDREQFQDVQSPVTCNYIA